MKRYSILLAIAGILATAGCNNLSLPNNWKELNEKAIAAAEENQNQVFNQAMIESVGGIDPEQTWNMAASLLTKGITIGILNDGTKAPAAAPAAINYEEIETFPYYYDKVTDSTVVSTTEDVKSSTIDDADFFILQEGNVIPIEFNSMDCWAQTTLGIYYYDLNGFRVEQELFGGVVGKIYIGASGTTAQRAAERAKTEGVKTITLEDGTAFGLYMISRTAPDIDKCYKTETINKYYSEKALNPDGLSHIRLQTKIMATTTNYKVTKQNIKVTRSTIAAKAEKCNSGDDGAINITKKGYYRWNGSTLEFISSFYTSNAIYISGTGYYKYVPEHYEYSETNNGKAKTTNGSVTSALHTEYLINYEDTYGGGDLDYNDLSLKVNTSIIKGSGRIMAYEGGEADYDLGPWMLLCEDLGSSNDNDFNDLIFTVNRPSATTMKIGYVAGGAVRQNYVLYNSGILAEIHEVFGLNLSPYYAQIEAIKAREDIGDAEKDALIMAVPKPNWFINTKMHDELPNDSETTWANPLFSAPMTVAEGLSMSTWYRTDKDNPIDGFSVRSDVEDYEVPFSPVYKGMAPYMICVPAKWKEGGEIVNFRWPQESISIFDAYPEFAGWAADHSTNIDWYKHPVESLVVDLQYCLDYINNPSIR